MSGALVFLDIETTGLDPARAEMWEVGAIVRAYGSDGKPTEEEHHWFLRCAHLETADAVALEIGGYHERHPEGDNEDPLNTDVDKPRVASPYKFVTEFEKLTRGATLVGANVRFDERFLDDYLRAHHRLPSWHFRMCDVEALAQGYLGLAKPTSLAKCANALEVKNEYDAHTALDDAKLARDVYDAVIDDVFGRRK